MFVTNCISTTKIQKISEITNFFRHYFLSRTEVRIEIDLRGGFSIFRLVATFVMMTDTPDTIATKRTKGNNQSVVVPLCSLYSF